MEIYPSMAQAQLDSFIGHSRSYQYHSMMREMEDSSLDRSNDSTIHSGHFMVSCVHEDPELTEPESPPTSKDDDTTQDELSSYSEGFDFASAIKEPAKSYKFGNKCSNTSAIDASLTKLFECMTLAYSGKLTSPKWKNFKGVNLPVKHKIRLNNIIWREWHMQYIQLKRPVICQFEPPISDKTHTKPEAVVMEGKYWKRRMQSVTTEYQKWRKFYKDHFTLGSNEQLHVQDITMALDTSREKKSETLPSLFPDMMMMTDEDFFMDLSDTLFTSINQPFAFPNPKEISQLGNADIIQPGLVQLQPNLDECMDTMEPLPSLQGSLSFDAPSSSSSSSSSSMLALNNINNNTSLITTSRHKKLTIAEMLNAASKPQVTPNQGVVHQSSAVAPISMDTTSFNQLQSPFGSGLETVPEAGVPLPDPVPNMSQQRMQTAQILDGLVTVTPIHTSQAIVPAEASSMGLTTIAQQTSTVDSSQILNLVLSTGFNQMGQLQFKHEQPQPPPASIAIAPAPQPVSQPQTVQQLLAAAAAAKEQQRLMQSLPIQQPQLSDVSCSQPQPQKSILKTTSSLQALLEGMQQQSAIPRPAFGPQTSTAVSYAVPSQAKHPKPGTKSHGDLQTMVAKPTEETRRASTGSLMATKREGGFLVPKIPVVPRTKQRILAPAVSEEPSGTESKTFLAKLLTQSLHQGPNVALKPEPIAVSSLGDFSCIQSTLSSAPTTTHSTVTFSLEPTISSPTHEPPVSDFQKSLLMAAASRAAGISKDVNASMLNETAMHCISVSNPGSPQVQVVNSPGSGGDSTGRSRHASNDSNSSAPMWDESPSKFRTKTDNDRQQYKELRRASHITAEQKRRFNIKVGFDTLHQLVPSLSQNPNSKVSKATALQKGAEYCTKLKDDRARMQKEMEVLKQEIESLNSAISVCQSQLPATGVPVTRQRVDQMRNMFDEYVKNRTLSNWKFWIFSIIITHLFDSYNSTVSTASVDELCRTVLAWLEQNCSLVALRPAVLSSLRRLSTTTSILSDPSKVPEQATQAVTQPRSKHSSGNS